MKNNHSISGIESTYGGSMYGDTTTMNVIDARNGINTYEERVWQALEKGDLESKSHLGATALTEVSLVA